LSEQTTIDDLAAQAISEIESGMTVGLGAGRTAARGIRSLAEKVRITGMEIQCVGASESAEVMAKELGLTMVDFATLEQIDILIDGADEIDRDLRVMKGSRGAITRERMLAWAARHTIYMVTTDKVSDRIGTKTTLAIAVMYFGLASTRAELRRLGLNGVVRRDLNNKPFVTDNANLILDVTLEGEEPLDELTSQLNDIPGIIDHALFTREADTILIEHEDGKIERLERPTQA
jgi:ribose 5-phosphate isomerase A